MAKSGDKKATRKTQLHKGDYVEHDFSKTRGQIIDTRKHFLHYDYLVRWRNGEGEDWYQRGVLVKV